MLVSIPARLFRIAKAHPERPAHLVKRGGVWRSTSYAQYATEVRLAARALISLGFQAGQRVCILGFNRPEWTTLDLAVMAAGGAPAGIYTTSSADEAEYILNHAEAPLVLVEDEAQLRKIEQKRDSLPHLKHIITMRGVKVSSPGVMTWEDFLARGDATSEKEVDERIAALEPQGLATLIYTSGTTGPPKAVMLSHENLAWTADALREVAFNGASSQGPIAAYLGKLASLQDRHDVADRHLHRALDLAKLRAAMNGDAMIDLRNIYRSTEIEAAGFRYSSIGR